MFKLFDTVKYIYKNKKFTQIHYTDVKLEEVSYEAGTRLYETGKSGTRLNEA